eukprot:scaffold100042_cov34-Phaeocystis_antarctica.AAC.2
MRTLAETRARSAQGAGNRALNLGAFKANQACNPRTPQSVIQSVSQSWTSKSRGLNMKWR